jgi:hypothetical protein
MSESLRFTQRIAAAANRQCTYHLPEEAGDVAVTARWDPRATPREGDSIAGACFMFKQERPTLPPRP